jgi:DNA-directed RNA polymerase specialized sigma24 family protein
MVRSLLADRHSAESKAMFELLMRYTHRRVIAVSRACGAALSDAEQEELVGEVIVALLQGALAGFRGAMLPELMAFVRTIADRTTWRTIRSRERERRTAIAAAHEAPERYSAQIPRPDQHFEWVPDSPLPEADQGYLLQLLEAGSKAELARRAGVSRAAVTQRVQRIVARVALLAGTERAAHEVWLEQRARQALDADPALVLRLE